MQFVFWVCGLDGDPAVVDVPLRDMSCGGDSIVCVAAIKRAVDQGNAISFDNYEEFQKKLMQHCYLDMVFRQFHAPFSSSTESTRGILSYNIGTKHDTRNKLYFVQSKHASMEVVYTNHMNSSGILVLRMNWETLRTWHCKEGSSGLSPEYKATWDLRTDHMRTILKILTGNSELIDKAVASFLYNDRKDIVITTKFAAYLGLL